MQRKQQRRDEVLFKKIIERMKEIRTAHGHTQEYVIENTGVDLSHIENGKNFPSLTSISIFCTLYGITLQEFFAPMNYPSQE